MLCTGVGGAPLGPNRAFRPGYFDCLMMTERRKRLDNDRVCTVGEANRRGEMVVQIPPTRIAGCGTSS